MRTIQLTQNTGNNFFSDTPAVQVKMFIHNHPKDAEQTISQWLKENDVTIHHIVQSQSEKAGSFIFVVTVFYLSNN
jgi:hypothetical protein